MQTQQQTEGSMPTDEPMEQSQSPLFQYTPIEQSPPSTPMDQSPVYTETQTPTDAPMYRTPPFPEASSEAPKASKKKPSRSVSNLTHEQLERKRANDREAQRNIRLRTKQTIAELKLQNAELQRRVDDDDERIRELLERNRLLESQVCRLQALIRSVRACRYRQPVFGVNGQPTDGSQPLPFDQSSAGPDNAAPRSDPSAPISLGVSSPSSSTGHPEGYEAGYVSSSLPPAATTQSGLGQHHHHPHHHHHHHHHQSFENSPVKYHAAPDLWPTGVPMGSAVAMPMVASDPCSPSTSHAEEYITGCIRTGLAPPGTSLVSGAGAPQQQPQSSFEHAAAAAAGLPDSWPTAAAGGFMPPSSSSSSEPAIPMVRSSPDSPTSGPGPAAAAADGHHGGGAYVCTSLPPPAAGQYAPAYGSMQHPSQSMMHRPLYHHRYVMRQPTQG
ncbi:hypothetical protein VTK56DRAFT_6272 [Thermocarpiscus australiensis]